MDLTLILFSVLGFLAVVLALEGLYNLWASGHSAEALRVRDRLSALRGEAFTEVALERDDKPGRFAWFQAMIERVAAGERLTHWVEACGTTVTAGELLLLSAGLGLVGLLLPGLLGQPPVLGLVLGVVLAALPWWRMSVRRERRVRSFEIQFPEALDLMCRAMRAGHAFATAVKLVGEESNEPLSRDFRILFDELNYGLPMEEALLHLAHRVPLPDVSYFVIAVLLQREAGGNLAELMEKISSIVRARLKLMGDVRTLSAEGRLSGIVLTVLPFAVALAVSLLNPKYLSVLWTDPVGLRIVGVALLMMVLGVLWMRRIIAIRV